MLPGGKASTTGEAMVVELLDEYWCFRNLLVSTAVSIPERLLAGGGAMSSAETDKEKEAAVVGDSAAAEGPPAMPPPVCRSLLRTPSLPPRVGRERPIQDGACPHRSGGGAKLLHSYSNLESVLLPLSTASCHQHLSSRSAERCGGAGRRRRPWDARVESIIRYVDSHHRAITGEGRRPRQAFQQVKKWRSLGDLETEEVQGFEDLGFVFDKEVVSPGVLAVIPGLRGRSAAAEEVGGGGEEEMRKVRRPYLSEAWVMQRSAPPALDWVDRSSAADVKEQLRFWAQVVASNVRQEC